MTGTLILARHAQSQGNKSNVFTGLSDLPLSDQGRVEAGLIAEKLRAAGLNVDIIFTSALGRTRETAAIVVAALSLSVSIIPSAALNERDYGKLTGLNKEEASKEYGAKQLQLWRRSFDARPPEGESLSDTKDRVVPFFEQVIKLKLVEGDTVFVIAHGNSLRALVMHLEHLSTAEIEKFEIATGQILIYDGSPVGRSDWMASRRDTAGR